jgi:hypothetical protein
MVVAWWYGGACVAELVDAADWERVRPWLLKAEAVAPFDSVDWARAEEMVKLGTATTLVVKGPEGQDLAGALCEIKVGKDGDGLLVRWLGGARFIEWVDVLWSALQDVARANGCRWVVIVGRDGWQRALRDKGFRTYQWAGRAEVANG